MAIKPRDLSKMIDHTLLSATANVAQIRKLCKEAVKHKFASVCVSPIFVPMCVKLIKDSSVKITSVIGYPLGTNTTEAKAFQTRQLVKEGAQELDMVINLGALKSGAHDLVRTDIKAVVDAARISSLGPGALIKVILETSYLTEDEIFRATELALQAGADFIQTSSGFTAEDTTLEHVSAIRKIVGREIGVKTVGKFSSFTEVVDMLDAGANRIGTDSGVQIIKEKK